MILVVIVGDLCLCYGSKGNNSPRESSRYPEKVKSSSKGFRRTDGRTDGKRQVLSLSLSCVVAADTHASR